MMSMLLSFKLVLVIVVVGFLANYVVYSTENEPFVDAVTGWREASGGTQSPSPTNENLVRGFLGSQPQINIVERSTANTDTSIGVRTLVYNGVTYRLTGLVVSGSKSAATLISEASDPIRVAVGGQLPGGQEVRAITLNEIVVINSEGREESVRIYE